MTHRGSGRGPNVVERASHLSAADLAASVALRRDRLVRRQLGDGPRCLGWYYKAGPGAPQSLLRTGWHAVGEPCPREVSDAILDEVYRARRNYQTIAQSIWDAAAAAGLEDVERRHGQITRGSVVCRVQYAAAGIGSGQ